MRLSRRVLVPVLLPVLLPVVLAGAPASADDPGMTSETSFGYNVGAVPREGLITQVSASWNVAAATRHSADEAESARAFVSLGGGCVTYDCRLRDDTRIRVGTESAVDRVGVATYRAWFQVVPFDRTEIDLVVDGGDVVRATIERASGLAALWRLTLSNETTGESFTTTTPAPSMLASVQWLVESEVLTDEFGTGYPLLPDLDVTRFDSITLNGVAPALAAGERVTFVPAFTEDVVGTPSLPDAEGDGFAACAWATACAV